MVSLAISEQLLTDIKAHLIGTYPNEGGGFLVGKVEGNQRIVTETHHVQNVFEAEEQFHRFLAESGTYEKVEDDADTRGLTLLGYYHSHPNAPAIPSEYDRAHALPFFLYLIVSVRNQEAQENRVWQLKEDRSTFEELTLTVSP